MGHVRQRCLSFPQGFLWGTASSSYQCEGANVQNQWYRWEQQGHILSGDRCGQAADWWQRAEEDFARAEQMENTALRLSLEWSRIEPTEGHWDHSAIERYRAMLQDLRRRHMTPLVTLHHFTEPLWFAERGSFLKKENIRYFIRYVQYVATELGDLCTFWMTFNEPNIYVFQGYLSGFFPPGIQNLAQSLIVLRNVLQAHAEAFYALRARSPESQIGYCLHYRLFDPARPSSLLDRSVAHIQEYAFNWSLLHSGERGHFFFPFRSFLPAIPEMVGTRDYHGINYYSRDMVRFDPHLPGLAFGQRIVRQDAPRNDAGLDVDFGEIYPYGLFRVLQEVYRRTRGNKPIYITENGFSDRLDDRRPAALLMHLVMVHRALQQGIPVRGYFHWSLTDNFEWNNGWYVRFGLFEIDPLTQKRVPRRSASLYREICSANAITEEIVEQYVPELLADIFPSDTERRLDVPHSII